MGRKCLIKTMFVYLKVLMIIVVIGLVLISSTQAATKKPYELPKTIYWGSRFVGSSLYTTAVTMSEKVAPALGRKIRLIPGEDVEMINMLFTGRVHLATFSADNYWASMGLANYANFAMGPQPLKMIWPGSPLVPGTAGMATKTSGIMTPYDLKGKRLARLVGAAWSDMSLRAQLAFGNLTYNDVTVVDVSSAGALYKTLVEGKADYTSAGLDSPGAFEIASSPYGLVVVSFPHEDNKGWARMQKVVPYFLKGWATTGPAIKPGEKIPHLNYPWPITTTLASQNEEFVYAICKAIHSKMDEIIAAYQPNLGMRVERGITPEASIMAPYHRGAIKFFKKIGVWTKAHEAANEKRLAYLERLNKRWAAFVEEAEEKMAKTGKKVDPLKEWPEIVEKEIGLE